MINKKGIIIVISFVLLSGFFGVGGVILGSNFANNKNKIDINENNDKEDNDEENNNGKENDNDIDGSISDDEKNDLYYNLKKQAVSDDMKSKYVTYHDGINFSNSSSDNNGRGIYKYSLTGNLIRPILYFRGEVDNNNVIFANHCWKIVRTTETGGIKILYNGTPADGKCPGDSISIGKSAFNVDEDGQLYLSGYMYGNTYKDLEYLLEGDSLLSYNEKGVNTVNFVYGSDVVYENGVYKLKDKFVSTNGYFKDKDSNIVGKRHYTCFSTSDTCSSVYFLRDITLNYSPYVVKLENGKKIEDILNDSVLNVSNEKNSLVKDYIDIWFENYLIDYKDYLEDALWCNDRSVSDYGDYTYDLKNNAFRFGIEHRENFNEIALTCSNPNDNFTVSNIKGNKNLTYPIGLLTADELIMAGLPFSSLMDDFENLKKNYLYAPNGSWWTMTPKWQSYDRIFMIVADYSGVNSVESSSVNLIRPAVVLKKDTKISKGDGTVNNPYVITK